MRRKVVITAALLHNPPVVFFDEPLDGLDANAAVGFKALIQTLAREGKTIVYSSHFSTSSNASATGLLSSTRASY